MLHFPLTLLKPFLGNVAIHVNIGNLWRFPWLPGDPVCWPLKWYLGLSTTRLCINWVLNSYCFHFDFLFSQHFSINSGLIHVAKKNHAVKLLGQLQAECPSCQQCQRTDANQRKLLIVYCPLITTPNGIWAVIFIWRLWGKIIRTLWCLFVNFHLRVFFIFCDYLWLSRKCLKATSTTLHHFTKFLENVASYSSRNTSSSSQKLVYVSGLMWNNLLSSVDIQYFCTVVCCKV